VAHPLDGAFKRIDRADSHIEEMKALIKRFRNEQQDKIIAQKQLEAAQLDLKPGQKLVSVERKPLLDLPDDIPIVVGETIYNIRAALDYFIYELAIKDSGSPKFGTQFLIEDTKSDPKYPRRGFDGRKGKCLVGLTPAHVDMVEALQPYRGCNWAKALRDISNPDKHRHLTAIAGREEETINFECGVSGSFDDLDLPGKVTRGVGGIYTDDYLHLEYAIHVTFSDRAPVVKTLEVVKSNVASVLEAFKSEF
jgi:hypothetical protein